MNGNGARWRGRSIKDQPRWEELERPRMPLLKMAALAGGAHGSLAAQRSGGMAAAAKEPSWVDWDEEEEEEEEETVSATVEARAVVAGVEVAVCAAGS